MAGTHQVADNDPARAIAGMAEAIHRKARLPDIGPTLKYEAIRLLELCRHPDGAVPPPRELIDLLRYLLLPGRDTKGPTWRNTEFPNEPLTELSNRIIGYTLGFSKPQPETVEKIISLLIPFEFQHPEDPSGNRPSAATDQEVARHVGDNLKNIRRWRIMPKILEIVASARVNEKV